MRNLFLLILQMLIRFSHLNICLISHRLRWASHFTELRTYVCFMEKVPGVTPLLTLSLQIASLVREATS